MRGAPAAYLDQIGNLRLQEVLVMRKASVSMTWVRLLALVLLAARPAAAPAQATRLHIIFVCDQNAQNIGPGMVVNQGLMTKVIQEAFSEHQERLGKWNLIAPRRNDILTHINSLAVKPSDSIFFYYCGHGGWDPARQPSGDEKGHYLAMSGGTLYRSELRSALLAKRPFSIVILTDCCSSIAGVEPPHRNIPAAWEGFHDLFFLQPGIFDIQSATRNQFGWSDNDNGGFFTRVLAKWLCEPRGNIRSDGKDDFVTWKEFFRRLRDGTVELFNQTQKAVGAGADIKKYEPETPQAFYLGQWPRYARYVKIVNKTGFQLNLHLDYYTYDPSINNWRWVRHAKNVVWPLPPGYNGYIYESLNGGANEKARAMRVVVSATTSAGGVIPQRDYTLTPPEGYMSEDDDTDSVITFP